MSTYQSTLRVMAWGSIFVTELHNAKEGTEVKIERNDPRLQLFAKDDGTDMGIYEEEFCQIRILLRYLFTEVFMTANSEHITARRVVHVDPPHVASRASAATASSPVLSSKAPSAPNLGEYPSLVLRTPLAALAPAPIVLSSGKRSVPSAKCTIATEGKNRAKRSVPRAEEEEPSPAVKKQRAAVALPAKRADAAAAAVEDVPAAAGAADAMPATTSMSLPRTDSLPLSISAEITEPSSSSSASYAPPVASPAIDAPDDVVSKVDALWNATPQQLLLDGSVKVQRLLATNGESMLKHCASIRAATDADTVVNMMMRVNRSSHVRDLEIIKHWQQGCAALHYMRLKRGATQVHRLYRVYDSRFQKEFAKRIGVWPSQVSVNVRLARCVQRAPALLLIDGEAVTYSHLRKRVHDTLLVEYIEQLLRGPPLRGGTLPAALQDLFF